MYKTLHAQSASFRKVTNTVACSVEIVVACGSFLFSSSFQLALPTNANVSWLCVCPSQAEERWNGYMREIMSLGDVNLFQMVRVWVAAQTAHCMCVLIITGSCNFHHKLRLTLLATAESGRQIRAAKLGNGLFLAVVASLFAAAPIVARAVNLLPCCPHYRPLTMNILQLCLTHSWKLVCVAPYSPAFENAELFCIGCCFCSSSRLCFHVLFRAKTNIVTEFPVPLVEIACVIPPQGWTLLHHAVRTEPARAARAHTHTHTCTHGRTDRQTQTHC